MRAQQTAEAIFREVYSKGRMCVFILFLIALLRVFFICYFFCFGVSSYTERPVFQKGIWGRTEMMFFPFLFLAYFCSVSTFLL